MNVVSECLVQVLNLGSLASSRQAVLSFYNTEAGKSSFLVSINIFDRDVHCGRIIYALVTI